MPLSKNALLFSVNKLNNEKMRSVEIGKQKQVVFLKISGRIIENLSGRKLAVLMTFLLVCQLICFLVGGLVAPNPVSMRTILATVCKETTVENHTTTEWFYSRGKGACKPLHLFDPDVSETENVVFTFQLPIPREMDILEYSRWQQNLIGLLQIDMKYKSMEVKPRINVRVDARLAYRNKGDKDDAWNLYAQSIEKRHLDCNMNIDTDAAAFCEPMPLFELGSLFHNYYLLNVRLPIDSTTSGHIQDMWLSVINQNEGFTKVWMSLKTVFFPCIIATLVWFWRRIHMLERKPELLEKMILSLGIAVTILNMPLEYITLQYDLPFMLLLEDIKQGVFYATLFSFWLVFVGEHMLNQDASEPGFLKRYWRQLGAIAIGCTPLFIFDMYERCTHLRNPFYSIWAFLFYITDIDTNIIPITFIILAGIFTVVYFLFLYYQVYQVFKSTSETVESLPTSNSVGSLNYEEIIDRLKFSMLAKLLCAALTVIVIIFGLISRTQWKWEKDIELVNSSAFFTGVYGMWNIYTFAVLILYAPSYTSAPENKMIENTQKFYRK